MVSQSRSRSLDSAVIHASACNSMHIVRGWAGRRVGIIEVDPEVLNPPQLNHSGSSGPVCRQMASRRCRCVALALAAAAVGQAFIVPGALVHKGARRAVLMKANTPLASEEEVKAEAGLKVGGTCGLGRPGLRTSAAAGCRAPAAHPQPTHESAHMRVTPCAAVMTNTHTTYTCSVAECAVCARTRKGSSCWALQSHNSQSTHASLIATPHVQAQSTEAPHTSSTPTLDIQTPHAR